MSQKLKKRLFRNALVLKAILTPKYIIVKVECDIRQILTVKAYKDGRGFKEYTCYVDSSHPCHHYLQEKLIYLTTNIHNLYRFD